MAEQEDEGPDAGGLRLTHDKLLGGALRVWQPATGFRVNTDAVFLAAVCPAQKGQSVLDLGCGVGSVGLCIAHRTDAIVTGVEHDPETAALARRNAAQSLAMQVVEADVAALPAELRAQTFDHVVLNPPYYAAQGGTVSKNARRDMAMRENLPLTIWLDAAVRRLRPKGTLSIIVGADRLPDLVSSVDVRLGDLHLLPIQPRAERAANRVILQGRKGAHGPFVLCAPFVVHAAETHQKDGEDLTAKARAILRDGAALQLK